MVVLGHQNQVFVFFIRLLDRVSFELLLNELFLLLLVVLFLFLLFAIRRHILLAHMTLAKFAMRNRFENYARNRIN